MTKETTKPAAAKPPKAPKAKRPKKERAPVQTARGWARGLGREGEYRTLTRDQKESVRRSLRALKRRDRVEAVAEKARARLEAETERYNKKKAYAEKQLAALDEVNAAQQTLDTYAEELNRRHDLITKAPTPAATPATVNAPAPAATPAAE